MNIPFITPIAETEVEETSWGDHDPGVTYLDGFGCCPTCRMGPYGPGIYVCQNPRCTED